jgi:cytochrome c-type biogenesis protein CcmH/NrfF
MPPIAEMMARYFALLVSEERSLPSVEEMQASIAADTERELGQYIHDGKRVSTLVDYMTVLTGEW